MRRCSGCGGILGRDCYNEADCVMISHNEEQYSRGLLQDLLLRVEALERKLGIQEVTPVAIFDTQEDSEIPF